jgi:hypothetical protein
MGGYGKYSFKESVHMTNRELFDATMRNENGDKILHLEQCFNVPVNNWYREGLPRHVVPDQIPAVSEKENLFDHFNVTGFLQTINDQFCIPAFDEQIIEIKNGRKIYINPKGNKMAEVAESVCIRKDGSYVGSPPHEIDFAIKTMRDYEENRFRYTGSMAARSRAKWVDSIAPSYRDQKDYIATIWAHGPFAFLRELLGTESAIVMPYEDPKLVRMILKDHLEKLKASSEYFISSVCPDCSFIWEDCCGSSGPFISPSVFDEQFGWWYREWKDFLVSSGVRWAVLDTDGDPSPLVRRWYGAGINSIHPWEVNSVDMLNIAKDLPPENVMMGGIYKHIFEPGAISQVGKFKTTDVHEAVDDELERVLIPMMKRGGYIASLDHAANYAVSYESYKYYSDSLLKYGKANSVTRSFSVC